MANHESVAALPVGSAANKQLLRDLLDRRMAYVVSAASEVPSLVAVDPASGAAIVVITCLGRNFLYDSTDTTTAHDGTTCLVSVEGRRYKLASGTDVFAYSVLDRDLATPPGSPTINVSRYLIAAGATGAWAGHSNEVTVFTARGWEFITFGNGRLLYVEDEDVYVHKNAGGSWVAGFGAQSLSAGSILPSMMLGGAVRVRFDVENQTTNTPPAVTNGNSYIIGSSPTGAWSGHAAKIAHGENSAWVIYTPAEGWRVWDKATDQDYIYTGSAWVSAAGRWRMTLRRLIASTTWSKPARLIGIKLTVIGAGSSSSVNGGTTSFGAHASATGGTAGGAAGVGSNGDTGWNLTGETSTQGARAPLAAAPKDGKGSSDGGQAGGAAMKYILAATLGATEAVTIGAHGTGGTGDAGDGAVYIEEYTEI